MTNKLTTILVRDEVKIKNLIAGIISEKDNVNDLYQDMYIILANKKQSIIDKVVSDKAEYPFIIQIIRNQIWSDTSPYFNKYKKFISKTDSVDTITELSYDITNQTNDLLELDTDYKKIYQEIQDWLSKTSDKKKNGWYHKRLFEMYYFEGKSYRKIQSETNIPLTSIFNSVKATYKALTLEFDKDIQNVMNKLISFNKDK
tara:strand:- start:219 stop:821 length:603 start_codon:yes stop_codon:yes gene_type:complete